MRPILVALVMLLGTNFLASQNLEDFTSSHDFSETSWLEQLESHYAIKNSVNQLF